MEEEEREAKAAQDEADREAAAADAAEDKGLSEDKGVDEGKEMLERVMGWLEFTTIRHQNLERPCASSSRAGSRRLLTTTTRSRI